MKNFEILDSEYGNASTVIFNANDEELSELKKYFDKQKEKGISEEEIIKEFFSLGWTKAELNIVFQNELKRIIRKKTINNTKYFIFFIVTLLVAGVFNTNYPTSIINVIFIFPLLYFIFKVVSAFTDATKVSIIDRRIILFFQRLNKIFGINGFPEEENYFSKTKIRNKRKIFLPVQERSQFKAFGGHGKYNNKKYNIFIALKYSHSQGKYNTPVFSYFIFYEFEINPVPFHYALVTENYFAPQSKRLQNSNLEDGDFQDMDFAAREFNKNWKLRGSDKKMAYQVFGPHMLSLILTINVEDFIGLEISDSSVILSNRFTRNTVNRCVNDFKLTYEIAKQVERNYREVKW